MFERCTELVKFYHSARWRKISRLYLQQKNFICERCGELATIVHHKQRLNANNVDNAAIALSENNLEALCLSCHNREHFGINKSIRECVFDAAGNCVGVRSRESSTVREFISPHINRNGE